MDDLISLITTTYVTDELSQRVPSETSVDVWATISTVTRDEFFDGGQIGITPDIMVSTPTVNYNGQDKAEVNGIKYYIYRTYTPNGSDYIELYLAKRAGITNGN